MTTLASMLMPIVNEVDPARYASLEQVIGELADVPTDVVGYETASKTLPAIRQRAASNRPSVLTKGGRAANGSSTLVISMAQILELLSRMADTLQKDASERRPADAILNELVAIKGEGRSLEPGLGKFEETRGGHIRL